MATVPLAPELRALLDDARTRPEDDGPRLVLADWLEDHGDADRAELIRLELRLERLPSYDPEVHAVDARHGELLKAHVGEWLEDRASSPLARSFKRGLIRVSAILRPPERAALREAARAPGWAWVEGLDLWRVNEGGFASLPGAALEGINFLQFNQDSFSPATAREWASSPHLGRLKSFTVNANPCGLEEIEALASSPNLDRLTALTLNSHGNHFTSTCVRVLAQSPRLAGLTFLDLGSNALSASGVAELARARALDQLEHLCLHGAYSGEEGAEALAKRSFPRLTTLDFRFNRLSATGIRALLAGDLLCSVVSLDLSDNLFGCAGAQLLAQASGLTSLTSLELRGNKVRAEGAIALVDSPHLNRLASLDLSSNDLGDEDAARLARSPGLARLAVLRLDGNGIGPEGARALAESPHLGSLRFLVLSTNPIKEKGARALADSPHLERLAGIDLRLTGLGERAVKKLHKRFGDRLLV
jgi:uncharacterized protein (TIGR02996 family)